MAKTAPKSQFSYPAELVWAAACAAHRINGGYFKLPQINEEGETTKPANRELVQLYVTEGGQQFITDKDREHGEMCRLGLLRNITITVLKHSELNSWDEVTNRVANLETVTTSYELFVIAALPKTYYQLVQRDEVNSRLARCDQKAVASDGTKIEFELEVVRVNFSQKYGTYYVSGITPDNRSVFFAFHEKLPIGDHIKVRGRVKRYTGSATQFSRVKLVEQEAV